MFKKFMKLRKGPQRSKNKLETKLFSNSDVDGLVKTAVQNATEIHDLIEEGGKSRTIAATNMNSESSRSHAVFTVYIIQV